MHRRQKHELQSPRDSGWEVGKPAGRSPQAGALPHHSHLTKAVVADMVTLARNGRNARADSVLDVISGILKSKFPGLEADTSVCSAVKKAAGPSGYSSTLGGTIAKMTGFCVLR